VEAGKKQFAGTEIAEKSLGVIGLGAIGGRIANDAYRLGMNVLGYDPYVSIETAWNISSHVKRVADIKEIFEKSDYITIHVPLTDDTRATFDQAAFGLMQKAADYEQRFFESLTKMLRAEIDFAVSAPDYFRLRTNLLNSPEHSECYEVFYPHAKKIENLMLDFFNLSAKEFGNMKGKEELYSSLFLANICSIAMRVASGLMKSDEKILYTIVHSFVYGFAD